MAACQAGWMPTVEDVRKIALGMPGAYEQASYHGQPSFRTKPRGFAHVRDDVDLVVHLADEGEKHALVAENPAVFHTTPHFDGYAAVLVRLAAVDPVELRELIVESWRLRAPARLVKEFDAAQ